MECTRNDKDAVQRIIQITRKHTVQCTRNDKNAVQQCIIQVTRRTLYSVPETIRMLYNNVLFS